MTWIVVAIVVLLLVGVGATGSIRLRRTDTEALRALGGIDEQLTRRADLIPDLVNAVKVHATLERAVFDEVTAARADAAAAADGGTIDQKSTAQVRLDNAVVDVLAVAEAYRELRASVGFQELHAELSATRSRLSLARQDYNDAVARLNAQVTTIPWQFLADLTRVAAREHYPAPAGRGTPPHITV